jgi:transcriptional regulator with XRE-family HTH domain
MYPNLRLQLWRKKIRQNQLAKLLEIDESMLSRILNGFRQPAPEIRSRIASLLQVDEHWLFQVDQSDPESAPLSSPRTEAEGPHSSAKVHTLSEVRSDAE